MNHHPDYDDSIQVIIGGAMVAAITFVFIGYVLYRHHLVYRRSSQASRNSQPNFTTDYRRAT